MAVLLPFIRMMAGPMDYTPGGMDNFTMSQFKSKFNDPGTLGTRCHQLAMYVTYVSPLQMLADTPTKYRKNPDSMIFLKEVPTTWDDTVVLAAEVGEVVAIARRNGERWFLGAMTNWEKRELNLPLNFLGKGNYTLRYWADGPGSETDPTDTTLGQKKVNQTSVIKVNLSPGGGYASIIEPEK
jgi:alpha-glucosidase